jgi:hypothetical protein
VTAAAGPCDPAFDRLAHWLGNFGCASARPVVQVRAPWELSNWTLPVIEAVMVAGAVFALVHAIRVRRRESDPTLLVLWLASLAYLVVVEPPLYFPAQFGIEKQTGIVFVHNVFTVSFLYDRLPLYIVALYPAMIVLAYEAVRSLGVFERRGTFIGAVCVGLVHQCFYEVFDQLGPQLRWWAWNPAAKSVHPAVAAVPLTSIVLFATVGPCALVLLARWLARRGPLSGWGIAWRALVAGALVPVAYLVVSIPSGIFGRGAHPDITAEGVVLSVELGLFVVTGLAVLPGSWRRVRAGELSVPRSAGSYTLIHGGTYLLILAILWITALPAYFGAAGGVTRDGTPTGSLPYAAVALLLAAVAVGLAAVAGGRRLTAPRPAAPSREPAGS